VGVVCTKTEELKCAGVHLFDSGVLRDSGRNNDFTGESGRIRRPQ